MTLKDRPIKYISCRRFIPPHTYNLNIHYWANWGYISGGKCTAAVDISGVLCIFVPSKCSLFIQ